MGKPKKAIQDLHAFLKEASVDHWSSGFDPKRQPVPDIQNLGMLMSALRSASADADWDRADRIMAFMPLYAVLLRNPKYAGHERHLENLTGAIAKRNAAKTTLHLKRFTDVVHWMASDRVFKDDEEVSIMRSRHGWYDGRIGGTVKPGSGGRIVVERD